MASRGRGARSGGRRGDRRPRKERRTVLLVTNGKVTEKIYLDQLVRLVHERSREVSVKVKFINGRPATLTKELSGPNWDLSAFKEVWVIVDHDGEDRSAFLRECRDLSTRSTSVHGVVSVPCFEVWLNAHYEPVRNYQNQVDAQRHYATLTDQQPGGKDIPDNFPWDAMSEAVDRCHLADEPLPARDTQGPCPSTTMPHLLLSLGLVDSVGQD